MQALEVLWIVLAIMRVDLKYHEGKDQCNYCNGRDLAKTQKNNNALEDCVAVTTKEGCYISERCGKVLPRLCCQRA